jgi:hypothetical protein
MVSSNRIGDDEEDDDKTLTTSAATVQEECHDEHIKSLFLCQF